MNSNTQIIAHFFMLSLGFGTQLLSPVVSTKMTGVGFYKLGTSIVLGCLILALGVDFYMLPAATPVEFSCYGILLLTNAFTYLFHRDDKSLLMWGIYILQVITFSVLTF